MGIKELWPFLNPYCVRKPLHDLQGKTVAIDLAGWICESLCVVDYQVQARFYLRNLFFRTCYLILSGITPVFVLEGTAPVLKHQMIAKRNQIQFRGARPRKNAPDAQESSSQCTSQATTQPNTQNASKGRTRFNYVLKQCEELIRSMGLQCVQGPGEAEAFCAHLNAYGLVDGVISQDSDCFAYGARRVFRNFSLSMQGTAGSIGGSVDIYDLDFVEKSIDFGRNKIVVMALLCGCDYCPEGVGGVGRDAVQKLFTIYSDKEILDRIQLWRKNDNKFTELEMKVDDKKLCASCGHYGRVQSHARTGCAQCKMSHGCDASIWKEKRLALKSELQIRKKAMQNVDFPSKDVIDEFMQQPIDMTPLQLGWCQPNVVKFVKMMGKLIQWDEIYCFQKFLPLLTRWQLHHICDGSENVTLRGSVQPDFIKKKRTPKGIPSYEIIWKDEQGCFHCLIPDAQLQMFYSTHKEKTETEALQLLWSTIEPMDLVEKAYPNLVQQFEESKAKGKTKRAQTKSKTTKSRKAKIVDIDAEDENIDSANVIKNGNTKTVQTKNTGRSLAIKSKKKPTENVRPIDLFFRKETVKSNVYASPKIKTSAKPMNLSAFSVEFNDSFTLINNDDMNLSAIINEMVSRPPDVTEYRGKKLRFDEITSKQCESFDWGGDSDANAQNMAPQNVDKAVDESVDDFDLIVMRKARKSFIDQKKSAFACDSFEQRLNKCSTPVLPKRIAAINSSMEHGSPVDLSYEMNDTKNHKNAVISSSFFAVNPDDEFDLFEKSIDFRNMQDVNSDDESDETQEKNSKDESDESESNELSHTEYNSDENDDANGINKYDTFDRLVGLC